MHITESNYTKGHLEIGHHKFWEDSGVFSHTKENYVVFGPNFQDLDEIDENLTEIQEEISERIIVRMSFQEKLQSKLKITLKEIEKIFSVLPQENISLYETGELSFILPQEYLLKAQSFLENYTCYIVSKYDTLIEYPEVYLCRDYSIDLSWRTNKARMLINISKKDNEYIAYYYGDLYNDTLAIKGRIPLTPIVDFFALWMKNLT